MRALLTSALLLAATPALADETSGEILAFDRVQRVIVLTDLTVWPLPEELALPEDLAAGDRIRIVYAGGGDAGVGKISSIERTEE
jgi:hypothetical protein